MLHLPRAIRNRRDRLESAGIQPVSKGRYMRPPCSASQRAVLLAQPCQCSIQMPLLKVRP
jgi:hypothetical protein